MFIYYFEKKRILQKNKNKNSFILKSFISAERQLKGFLTYIL